MTEELRARILAYNKQAADRKVKAEDLGTLIEKLEPIICTIQLFLPDEVKAILEKHGCTV